MLTNHIERYLSLRRVLGYKLRDLDRRLQGYARFADDQGDAHVRAATALAWATMGSSPDVRRTRLRDVVRLARFLHADDPGHEIPPLAPMNIRYRRPLPYIYAPEEISRLVEAAGRLVQTYPLRREVYGTLLGLIAATGLRVSEARGLKLGDVRSEGVLRIAHAKLGKSRLVPLHPTARNAVDRYLVLRRRLAVTDDHVFLSKRSVALSASTVNCTFRRILKLAKVAPERARRPRIHDIRHTFATRALERCPGERRAVSRHFVALSTYLGHADIAATYWYLEATPELMVDIASAGEALAAGGGR